MKNILVTGGTGYIGSHTAVELLQRGYHPILLDNLSNSREEVVKAIEKITGKEVPFFNIDLCDTKELQLFFEKFKIDACIHFAALKAVGESVKHPLHYYRNNLNSLINILEIYQQRKLDNFVFSSSCSVYGESSTQPVSETTPLSHANSPYGNTKQIGEEIIQDTIRSSVFHAISLRYFNPAGAHSSALIGEYPTHAPNNLVPVLTRTAIGKLKSMTVFGDDYDTGDGTCVRDYIHVSDIARAHVLAIDRLLNKESKNPYEVFNLGSGKGHSVLEAIGIFERVTGNKIQYQLGPRRPGDVPKVWADTKLANRELKWKAEKSIDEIMRSAWAWEHFLAATPASAHS